ncbi:hypothetical protein DX130_02875 [Paenibacillus paeoniae]|uniref:Uncharacterized protein n=1 Tax=Paenibacillus paeoniae TaxID=2292705 RepID=A0A371PJC6_9BACL|nr:hypothetical protein DX130_02875 [Paenibacillus paeoniae]
MGGYSGRNWRYPYVTAEFVIYVPDSGAVESTIMDFIWEEENRNITFIRSWLVDRCGEPRELINKNHDEEEFRGKSEGYCIDEFLDLN